MVEIKRVPPGKAIGYERDYDKKGNPVYGAGELATLDNDTWKKRVSAVPYDENNVMYDFRDYTEYPVVGNTRRRTPRYHSGYRI